MIHETEIEYVGQRDSKYADCLLRVMVNACRFYKIPCPDPDKPEQWEPVVDFAGCRYGTPTTSDKDLAEYFGLKTTRVASNRVVGRSPLLLTVYNPEVGHNFHAVLVTEWEGKVATVINYRVEKGPLVEQIPLVHRKNLPRKSCSYNELWHETAEGIEKRSPDTRFEAPDQGVYWDCMAIPTNSWNGLLEPI